MARLYSHGYLFGEFHLYSLPANLGLIHCKYKLSYNVGNTMLKKKKGVLVTNSWDEELGSQILFSPKILGFLCCEFQPPTFLLAT